WGHGRNFQNASPIAERAKQLMSRRVHWWFCYNDLSAEVVAGLGYPPTRITVVNNAIDTRRMQAWRAATTDAELAGLRGELGLRGSHVAAFVGGLYDEKRLPYLIEACDRIRARVDDFEMLVLGGG